MCAITLILLMMQFDQSIEGIFVLYSKALDYTGITRMPLRTSAVVVSKIRPDGENCTNSQILVILQEIDYNKVMHIQATYTDKNLTQNLIENLSCEIE